MRYRTPNPNTTDHSTISKCTVCTLTLEVFTAKITSHLFQIMDRNTCNVVGWAGYDVVDLSHGQLGSWLPSLTTCTSGLIK